MYRFISPTGEVIKTKTVRQFSILTGLRYSNCKTLACGVRSTMSGFCSTHPRAARRRKRFTTVLFNTKTGATRVIGSSVKKCAEELGLCLSELSKLVNRRQIAYRGWVLLDTWQAAHADVADEKI